MQTNLGMFALVLSKGVFGEEILRLVRNAPPPHIVLSSSRLLGLLPAAVGWFP